MNSYERTMARLAGQPVDRPPNFDIMMQFAAHYIGQPLAQLLPRLSRPSCAANLAVQEAFDLDILQAISDPYREAADWGWQSSSPTTRCRSGRVPLPGRAERIWRKLKPPKPEDGRRMTDRFAAVRHFREQVGAQCRSWAGWRARWPRPPTCAA